MQACTHIFIDAVVVQFTLSLFVSCRPPNQPPFLLIGLLALTMRVLLCAGRGCVGVGAWRLRQCRCGLQRPCAPPITPCLHCHRLCARMRTRARVIIALNRVRQDSIHAQSLPPMRCYDVPAVRMHVCTADRMTHVAASACLLPNTPPPSNPSLHIPLSPVCTPKSTPSLPLFPTARCQAAAAVFMILTCCQGGCTSHGWTPT